MRFKMNDKTKNNDKIEIFKLIDADHNYQLMLEACAKFGTLMKVENMLNVIGELYQNGDCIAVYVLALYYKEVNNVFASLIFYFRYLGHKTSIIIADDLHSKYGKSEIAEGQLKIGLLKKLKNKLIAVFGTIMSL